MNLIDCLKGDSGGPLFVETSQNQYEIVGVASFGQGCADDFAGIYADISNSIWWIYSIINSAGVCPQF